MATLKTPGVYVEEITKFPPSIAPVATAIPAFIGYTEKATKLQSGDLNMVPTRISSMLEYQTYFGFAQNETAIAVEVTAENRILVENNTPSEYKMYYSLQMYFANGGGPCYIVSVGTYGLQAPIDPIVIGDLEDGLAAIRKQDEPTLLLFPDGQALSDSDYYAIQQSSLTQCADLQDRFAIMDTYGDGSSAIADFRIGIGTNNLKYGAAYYPFLKTILDYQYDEASLFVTDNSSESPVAQIETIASSIYTRTAALGTLIESLMTKREYIFALGTPSDTIAPSDLADVNTIMQSLIDHLNVTLSMFNQILAITASETDAGVIAAVNALDAWISSNIEIPIAEINAQQDKLAVLSPDTYTELLKLLSSSTASTSNTYSSLGLATVAAASAGPVAPPDPYTTSQLYTELNVNPTAEINAVISAYPSSSPTVLSLSTLKTSDNALYNRVKAAISDFPVTLPPSSAMAGIYSRVDNAIGVWKAPANVSVAYVQQPTVQISNEDQEDMNVTSTGKSVNAIRTFTGKGTLVWGARTLAGNDNEWKYIPVRRFFNFVEESVSEATEQFVFEPNTANTWVRVRNMIENFLLQQWKAGALAGAKPEDAFYVRIGLGQTMTSQDILEGRMIVEIGMAAVRPAEFIVLRFSHKMQES